MAVLIGWSTAALFCVGFWTALIVALTKFLR